MLVIAYIVAIFDKKINNFLFCRYVPSLCRDKNSGETSYSFSQKPKDKYSEERVYVIPWGNPIIEKNVGEISHEGTFELKPQKLLNNHSFRFHGKEVFTSFFVLSANKGSLPFGIFFRSTTANYFLFSISTILHFFFGLLFWWIYIINCARNIYFNRNTASHKLPWTVNWRSELQFGMFHVHFLSQYHQWVC